MIIADEYAGRLKASRTALLHRARRGLAIGMAALCLASNSAFSMSLSQDDVPDAPRGVAEDKSELSQRQLAVSEQIARLEDRLFQLAQALKKTEPEKADRLMEGLTALRGKQVRERMSGIVKLLGDAKFSDALDQQEAVGSDLQNILKLLLQEPDNLEERKRELERLEAMKKTLEDVLREQEEEKRRAEEAARAQERAELLESAARHIKELIERQKALAQRSKQGGDDGKGAADQAELRGETEGVARDVKSVAEAEEQAAQADAQSPGDQSQGDQPQNGEPKSPDAGGAAGQGQCKAGKAAGKLGQATKRMQQAEQDLRQGDRNDAAEDQQQAAEDLEDALENIEEQAKEIRNRLKLEEQAAEQRKTARKTERLSKDMKGASGESGSPQDGQSQQGDSQSGEDGQQQKQDTPGSDQVQEAVPLQDEAAEKLDDGDPDQAAKKQQEALDKLKQAQEEVEDRLDQLRKEQQEELLAALESRFRAMLGRQLECNKATARLSELGADKWKRSDQLELAEIAQKQRWVGDEADQALFILTEEGSTVVLPQLIEQVRDDARLAADRLAAADAGHTVRMIQDELEQVLRDIIEAVKKKQEELENSGGGGASGGAQPLLPGSAELKLLRACQQRVNKMTTALEEFRAGPDADQKEVQSSLDQLHKRQDDVANMARTMHEALQRAQ